MYPKILLQSMSKNILQIFSPRTLMISGLIYRSLIHLEFHFICTVKGVLIALLHKELSQFPRITY